MKRQKNFRQLRGKSLVRKRLSDIKSRTVTPDMRFSDARVNPDNNSLFDDYAEKTTYGEPPEDRFSDTPLPDFQFDWDEEFFGTASPVSNEFAESVPYGLQNEGEVPVTSGEAEPKPEDDSGIPDETTGADIAETAKPIITATVETVPEQKSTVPVAAVPVRFVSVRRQKALAAREAEKLRKPAKRGGTPEIKTEAAKPAVTGNAVVKKADSPAGNKSRGTTYGLPVKTSRNIANAAFGAETTGEKPATGNSATEKKSEAPSLNVRRAPSFRSFVISTIHRLMEEQRFLALERESSRLLAREPGFGKKEEPAITDTDAREKSETGITRWSKPPATTASGGLARGTKRHVSKNTLPTEKQPATRSSLAHTKPKSAPGSYELHAARITLMEARINAKAISGNMKMKW